MAQSKRDDGANRGWNSLPSNIQDYVLAKLEYPHMFRAKTQAKAFKDRIESAGFQGCRGQMCPREGSLTVLYLIVRGDGLCQCTGYDLCTDSWMELPPFYILPRLAPRIYKDHLVCAAGGLMCVNVAGLASGEARLIVLNPLTASWRELPPLNYPRCPVLMQMIVNPAGDSYKIVVVGSSNACHWDLSKMTEVFDSRTSKWTIAQELPGPSFGLNEFQAGVHVQGIVYSLAFLEGDRGRGVVAFNVDEGKWVPHLSCPLPNSAFQWLNILQLVECDGKVFLFTEREHNGAVEHGIDLLEICNDVHSTLDEVTCNWRRVMRLAKSIGDRAGVEHLSIPEFVCVPYGEGKLCIFNTIERDGDVYEIHDGRPFLSLLSPICSTGSHIQFSSLNPLSFCFEPTFKGTLQP